MKGVMKEGKEERTMPTNAEYTLEYCCSDGNLQIT